MIRLRAARRASSAWAAAGASRRRREWAAIRLPGCVSRCRRACRLIRLASLTGVQGAGRLRITMKRVIAIAGPGQEAIAKIAAERSGVELVFFAVSPDAAYTFLASNAVDGAWIASSYTAEEQATIEQTIRDRHPDDVRVVKLRPGILQAEGLEVATAHALSQISQLAK